MVAALGENPALQLVEGDAHRSATASELDGRDLAPRDLAAHRLLVHAEQEGDLRDR
jgi:hypothetical protein